MKTTHPVLAGESTNAAPAPLDGLDVLDACHRETLFMNGRLAALISRLSTIGPDDEARRMAAHIVQYFSTTVRDHHADEERHLFPKLLTNADEQTRHTVECLKCDHAWMDANWHELSPQLDAVADGLNWVDLAVLRECAEVFIALSHDHIALEETILYPQARANFNAGERSQMGREMAARRMAARKKQPV